MKATIRQVAELAGVSITTVSHVLNNKEGTRVRQETQRRVLEAAKKLNYHPAGPSRVAPVRRTGNFGLVIPAESQMGLADLDVFSGVLGRICTAAAELGYGLLVEPAAVQSDGSCDLPAFAREGRADGCMVLGVEGQCADALIAQLSTTIPVVSIDREHSDVDCVLRENLRGSQVATNHLLSLGCRSVVCLCPSTRSGEPAHSIYSERVDGLMLALARSGAAGAASSVVMVPEDRSVGAVVALLNAAAPPDGVVILSRRISAAFADVASALSRGAGVHVVSFDDSCFRDGWRRVPMQSEVRIDSAAVAQSAIHLLANRIQGGAGGSLRVVVKAEFNTGAAAPREGRSA